MNVLVLLQQRFFQLLNLPSLAHRIVLIVLQLLQVVFHDVEFIMFVLLLQITHFLVFFLDQGFQLLYLVEVLLNFPLETVNLLQKLFVVG